MRNKKHFLGIHSDPLRDAPMKAVLNNTATHGERAIRIGFRGDIVLLVPILSPFV
jgi:hypothetical protein